MRESRLDHRIVISAPLAIVWEAIADLTAVQAYNPMVATAVLLARPARRHRGGSHLRRETRRRGRARHRLQAAAIDRDGTRIQPVAGALHALGHRACRKGWRRRGQATTGLRAEIRRARIASRHAGHAQANGQIDRDGFLALKAYCEERAMAIVRPPGPPNSIWMWSPTAWPMLRSSRHACSGHPGCRSAARPSPCCIAANWW